MKNILLSVTCFLAGIYFIKAQTLYGTTFNGGHKAGGTINKFTPASNNLEVLKSFEATAVNLSITSFVQVTDGKLYGIGGGGRGWCISSFDPSSSTYTYEECIDGNIYDSPSSSLMRASDGKLYGTMNGRSGSPAIFSFDPSSSTFKKLMDLDRNTYGISGPLMQASDGKLYGMASQVGSINGFIFSFDPPTSTYTKLRDFDFTDGYFPQGSLIQATDGKLYGMASSGGWSSNAGVIFSFDPSNSSYVKLKEFDDNDDYLTSGSLIQASDGKLYIIAAFGMNYGLLFSFDPTSFTLTKLKEFHYPDGDDHPTGSVMEASNGMLYGMMSKGGNSGDGIFYSFDPSSSIFTKLKDAGGSGSLIQAIDGKLYGITRDTNGEGGVIFSYDPSSSNYVKPKVFFSTDGSHPSGSLIRARDGRLYGLMSEGGSSGKGVIFSYDLSTSIYKKEKEFIAANGAGPLGSFMQASDGKLYGMMSAGGDSSAGVIFSYDPSSFTYTKLKDFDGINGRKPFGDLIQARDGKLYGMTSQGGSSGSGVIFSYDPTSTTYAKLKDFDGTDGANPYGSLMQASDGKLYGMTVSGGSGDNGYGYGVLFSFDPFSSKYTKLKDFDGTNGKWPNGSLMQASNGKLYGMTREGGTGVDCIGDPEGGCHTAGLIFSFDPASSTFTKLVDFDGKNGLFPFGNLMQASDGKLYGMTFQGGSGFDGDDFFGDGVIFSYDPSTFIYTKLKEYNGTNGANPGSGSAFIEVNDSITNIPPTVSLATPANNATYLAGGNVYIKAIASDTDGTISKVEFYNDTTLLYTATDTPYTFKWEHVYLGDYILTAKATDNDGLVATSAEVNISVVRNKPPVITIISPSNEQTFTAPSTINFEAAAHDADGRIVQVSFYNGASLLTKTEHKVPYTYQWQNVPAGVYTITALAKDNWSDETKSAPITIKVLSAGEQLVSSTQYPVNVKPRINDRVSLKLTPNPAETIINLTTIGLQKNNQLTILVLSSSGVVVQTMHLNNFTPTIPLNISSLKRGVYIIKIISGDNSLYKKFIKI